MSAYNDLKQNIDANIKENGQQYITGPVMNQVLNNMVEKTITAEDPEEYEAPGEGELGSGYYTKSEIDALLTQLQEKLVSGYNIKTVNLASLLGSGNIVIPQGPVGPKGDQGNSGYDGTGVEVVNNLTQGGATAALSAEMGKRLAEGYQYLGIATPDTDPGVPTHKVFYIATTPGTYHVNFGSLTVAEGEVAVLKWNSTWSKETTGIATKNEVSQLQQEVNGLDILQSAYLVNPDNYEKTEGALTTGGGGIAAWNLDGYNRYHKAIPIPVGINKITMQANNNVGATYVIAKSYTVPTTSGQSVDVAIGQTAPNNVPVGESVKIHVPSDATYLIIVVNSNSIDKTPSLLQFSSGICEEKIDKNLGVHRLAQSMFIAPGYISNVGVYEPNATTYRVTDYLLLNPGSSVRLRSTGSPSVAAIAVFDSSKQYVSAESVMANYGESNLEYENKSGQIRYVRLSIYYSDINVSPAYIDNIGVFPYESKTNEKINDIYTKLSYVWDYGNINTDGSIITPVAKNRIHSTLISILNLQKITTENIHYIGYALYDKDKTFITRWWTDDVSELDFGLIGLSNPTAEYVSILMMNTDNSDFNLETNQPTIGLYYESVAALTYAPKTIRMCPQTQSPVIIFNFDDCLLPGDYDVVKLFESRGARCGFAFIATDADIASKTKIYLDFQKRGFDIMNHSGGVQSIITANYTFDQAKALIVANGLERLQKAGFVINGFVCPNSEMSNDFLPIVAKTHAYNMIGTPYGANGRDADVNKLVRYSLENNTKSTIKSFVDDCISNDKCLIFYAHTSRFGQTIQGELFDIDKVAEILDYCIAKRNNLECYIGGCDDGIKYYFNL